MTILRRMRALVTRRFLSKSSLVNLRNTLLVLLLCELMVAMYIFLYTSCESLIELENSNKGFFDGATILVIEE